MTAAGDKISLIAAACLLCLGLLTASHASRAFAQNEPEPEQTTIEQPQAEPTEWTPLTAGDVERGAPSPNPEAASSPAAESMSAPSASPAEESTPGEESSSQPTPTPSPESTSTPSHHQGTTGNAHRGSHRSRQTSKSATSPLSSATTSAGTSPDHKSKPSSGGGTNVVPENSPFAGLNFGNQKGPTDIQSDTGTLDYQKKVALFVGHVHAVQAGGDLTSNTLKVQYGQDFNDIRMMYADGDVRMSQGLRWITSDHAVLDQSTHILTFFGNPVAHDQKDQITGSTIKVDLVSGKSTVDKPRVIIFPREGKNPDNVNAPVSP